MQTLAKLISWVLHPLFIPMYAFLVLLYRDPYVDTFFPQQLIPFFLSLMFINVLAPGVSIYMMKRRGSIQSFEMNDRKERIAPLLLVLFYYTISYLLLKWNDYAVPELVYALLFSVMVCLALALVVTLFWKISMHTLALSGILGALVGIYSHYQHIDMPLIYTLIFLIGVVGFARLLPRHHSLGQVYGGMAVGLVMSFFTVVVYLSYS